MHNVLIKTSLWHQMSSILAVLQSIRYTRTVCYNVIPIQIGQYSLEMSKFSLLRWQRSSACSMNGELVQPNKTTWNL